MCGHCCVLVVPLHARRGLSKVAVLRAYACCSLTKGHGLTRAGCNKRSIRKKGAAVEAVLRVSGLALPFAVFLKYVKVVGPGTVCVPGPTRLYGVLWRCPTLPHPPRCSTIGACGLSFQVRNGGWAFPRGYDHHKMSQPVFTCVPRECFGGCVGCDPHSGDEHSIVSVNPFTVSVCG